MLKKLAIAAGLMMALPTAAHAAGCDSPQTGFDNVYCFAKVYMDLDRQLNDNYGALMKLLGADQKGILRNGQRGWIGMRNDRCYRSEGGSNTVNIDCALATTRARIQFLSDRLAECRATGCNATKLGRITED
jgi:uncharacterized protein YecT (DUF1311 family)